MLTIRKSGDGRLGDAGLAVKTPICQQFGTD
jgi:hypothetical protein